MDPVEGSPDDDNGSIDSSDYGDDGNVGVRHVDSGSDDSDIEVEPLVDRPLKQYIDSSDDDDDDDPPPSEDDKSVPSQTKSSNNNKSYEQQEAERPVEREEEDKREKGDALIESLQRHFGMTFRDLPVIHAAGSTSIIELDVPPLAVQPHAYINNGAHLQLPGVRWYNLVIRKPTTTTFSAHKDGGDCDGWICTRRMVSQGYSIGQDGRFQWIDNPYDDTDDLTDLPDLED